MVNKVAKTRMLDFVVARIEAAGRYIINKADVNHVLLTQDPEQFEHPVGICVLLHARKMTVREYRTIVSQNGAQSVRTSSVFYKDGETFMVRLGGRGHFKGDGHSLKRYRTEVIDDMIDLRALEKVVLSGVGNEQVLVYFQPETTRLEESLHGYKMGEVMFDYSHVQLGDRGFGFAVNRSSLDYRIAKETFCLKDGPVGFRGQGGVVTINGHSKA